MNTIEPPTTCLGKVSNTFVGNMVINKSKHKIFLTSYNGIIAWHSSTATHDCTGQDLSGQGGMAEQGKGSSSQQQGTSGAASTLPLQQMPLAGESRPSAAAQQQSSPASAGREGTTELSEQASSNDITALTDGGMQQQLTDKLSAQLYILDVELKQARENEAEAKSSAARELSQARAELDLLPSGQGPAISSSASANMATPQDDLQHARQQLAESREDASNLRTVATIEVSQAYEELELAQTQLENTSNVIADQAVADAQETDSPAGPGRSSTDQQSVMSTLALGEAEVANIRSPIQDGELQSSGLQAAVSVLTTSKAQEAEVESLKHEAWQLRNALQRAQQDISQAQAEKAGWTSELETVRAEQNIWQQALRKAQAEQAGWAAELENSGAEQEMLQRALSTAQADAQAAMRKLQAERDGAATLELARAAAAKVRTSLKPFQAIQITNAPAIDIAVLSALLSSRMLLLRFQHATFAWQSMNSVVTNCPGTRAGTDVLMLCPRPAAHVPAWERRQLEGSQAAHARLLWCRLCTMYRLLYQNRAADCSRSAQCVAHLFRLQDVTNVLGQLRTMRFEREEEQEWLQELQQSLASAESRAASQDDRAKSTEAALDASSAASQQLQSHAAELQQHLLLQRVRGP